MANIHFSHETDRWATPRDLYEKLDAEFGFNFDPCPLSEKGGSTNEAVEKIDLQTDGAIPSHKLEGPENLDSVRGADGRAPLFCEWRDKRVYCNPPYGPEIPRFLERAPEAELAVFLSFSDHHLVKPSRIGPGR